MSWLRTAALAVGALIAGGLIATVVIFATRPQAAAPPAVPSVLCSGAPAGVAPGVYQQDGKLCTVP